MQCSALSLSPRPKPSSLPIERTQSHPPQLHAPPPATPAAPPSPDLRALPILVGEQERKKEDPRRNMRPDTPWIVGFATVIVGWFASSILSYYVPKILSVIGLGASKRLSDLKIRIIPELKKTLCDVDQERMMHRKGKLQSDVEALDKKASMLRHALEDAEDIFDDHHEIEAYRNNLWQSFCSGLKISWGWIAHIVWRGCAWLWRWVRKISFRLSEVTASAVATCAVSCVPVTQIVWSGFSGLSRWARMMSRAGATCVAGFNKSWTVIAGIGQFGTTRLSLLALRGSNGRLPVTNNHTIVHSHQPVRGTNVAASDETIPAEIHSSEGVLDSDAATHDEPVLEICPEALLPNDTSASANNPNAFALLRGSDDTPPITDNYVAHSHQPVPGINVSASDEIIPAEILSESVVGEPLTTSNPPSDEPAVVATNDVIPHGSVREICITRFNMSCMWIASSGPWFSHRWTSMRKWLVDAFEAVRTVRDEVCEGIGFTSRKEDATWIDFVLTAISIWKLKRRIEKVKSTVSYVKESAPLDVAKKSALEDIANKNKSSIRTTNMRTVFGRVAFRHKIVKKLLKRPPSSDRCFSAIGIYGVSGSGKTIFAQYTHDFIKDECKKKDKPFDTIMCVHVSKNFNLNDIFHAMLKDVTGHWQSKTLVREELKDKLQKKLCGKCFFLILDDIWMEDMYNQQLDELLSPLIDGKKGSKILVTTQDEDTAKILCGDETTYKIPDLDDDSFLNLLMHHAQVADGEHGKGRERESFGKLIAEKLHKSPIAAVIVAGRLAIRRDDMEFWQNTALNVKLDDTMDALWWSYQELPLDIRRCLEYCSIFPRRTNLTKTELVRLWIAQGFVSATEDMEDRAEGYVQKLVSRRFLEPTRGHDDCFTIHDRLHDLLDMVVGSDCFRIENERSQKEEGPLRIEKEEGPSRIEKEEGPLRIEEEEGWRGAVRHLFVQNYDAELITETVLGLKNLRTLIIYIVKSDTPVEEMVIESICKRLLKLRVLIIHFSNTIYEDSDRIFRFPKSVGQLKHLRYLGFRSSAWAVILPSTLNKLHHIQQLDFGGMSLVIPNFTGCLVNLLHIICKFCYFPHIGRIISLKTLPCFIVKDEEGYEVKQLRKLNKLRGRLIIYGLENVKSKEQADQANLAVKEQLTELYLVWALGGGTRCSPKDEAEVLEGLCPPMGLQSLTICCYEGSRYPDWMVGQHDGNPKDLQQLHFWRCNQTAPCLEVETFRRLRELWLIYCSWDALPDNMEHLTSLKLLKIVECLNIRSLPTLPQSLEVFELDGCNDELTAEHAIWKNNKRMSRTSSHITDDWDDNFASQGSDHSAAMNSYVRFMMTRLFLP